MVVAWQCCNCGDGGMRVGRCGIGSQVLLAPALLCSGTHFLHSGPVSLLGWVLSGALVAAWALTSARHVCAAQPLDWRAFAKATSTGGMVAPIVAVAELLIGEPVWIAIGTGAVLWLVIVTPDGKFTLPRALRALFPPLPPRAG